MAAATKLLVGSGAYSNHSPVLSRRLQNKVQNENVKLKAFVP
jgi:hypothetical protein